MNKYSSWCPNCGRHVSELWPHDATCQIEIRDGHIAELEKRLAAAEAKIPKWVPVTERLPEKYATCLVVQVDKNGMNDGPMVAYFEEPGWFSGRFGDVEGVTHWMPLPDAPGGGE